MFPVCSSKQMKDAWDERRTVEYNLQNMGLSADPNKTLAMPKPMVRYSTSLTYSSLLDAY